MKIKKLFIFTLTILLSSCSKSTEPLYLRSGFAAFGDPGGWLRTAMEVKTIQEGEINVEVFAGYYAGFIDRWYSDKSNPNPLNGHFAIDRCIRLDDTDTFDVKYITLEDFEDESKYKITNWAVETQGEENVKFNFSFTHSIPLDDFKYQKGRISFGLCLVDDNNNFMSDIFKYGMNRCSLYYFKEGRTVKFSEKLVMINN